MDIKKLCNQQTTTVFHLIITLFFHNLRDFLIVMPLCIYYNRTDDIRRIKMRGKNLVQLIHTLTLLSNSRGATKKEMASKLNISIRSVSRSIRAIEALGVPIYDETSPFEREKRWHIEPTYIVRMPNMDLPKISLTIPEIISLCMLTGESALFKETKIHTQITTALAKLMHFVPQKTQKELSGLKQIFISKTIGSKTYTGQEKTIGTLTESILNRTSCLIRYHAFYKDELEDVEIGPLHFYENSGGLYLFGLKMETKDIRTYAVERIKKIRPLKGNVDYPKNFNPEQILNSAFNLTHGDPVSIKICFTRNEAPYIKEKSWSPDQQIQEHPDRSITLTMTTSGRRDVKRWVMSFGKEATLLKPEDLRQEIEDELKFMIEK